MSLWPTRSDLVWTEWPRRTNALIHSTLRCRSRLTTLTCWPTRSPQVRTPAALQATRASQWTRPGVRRGQPSSRPREHRNWCMCPTLTPAYHPHRPGSPRAPCSPWTAPNPPALRRSWMCPWPRIPWPCGCRAAWTQVRAVATVASGCGAVTWWWAPVCWWWWGWSSPCGCGSSTAGTPTSWTTPWQPAVSSSGPSSLFWGCLASSSPACCTRSIRGGPMTLCRMRPQRKSSSDYTPSGTSPWDLSCAFTTGPPPGIPYRSSRWKRTRARFQYEDRPGEGIPMIQILGGGDTVLSL